ncbi:unnamed protein product [Aphis gossypii]|uniref:Uncharacterized protein n=1 Tax=Aphis gossypii TaxID=80765 RepID=A0A9P0IR18_APHGO|nr:unnamed protein product [Aphis gossypii]
MERCHIGSLGQQAQQFFSPLMVRHRHQCVHRCSSLGPSSNFLLLQQPSRHLALHSTSINMLYTVSSTDCSSSGTPLLLMMYDCRMFSNNSLKMVLFSAIVFLCEFVVNNNFTNCCNERSDFEMQMVFKKKYIIFYYFRLIHMVKFFQ